MLFSKVILPLLKRAVRFLTISEVWQRQGARGLRALAPTAHPVQGLGPARTAYSQ